MPLRSRRSEICQLELFLVVILEFAVCGYFDRVHCNPVFANVRNRKNGNESVILATSE